MPEYALLEMLPSPVPEIYTMIEGHPHGFAIRDYDGVEIVDLDIEPAYDQWSDR